MLIDTHCHLNFKDFDNQLTTIVCNAKKAGIKKIIVPGTDLKSSLAAFELSKAYPNVLYAAIGFHPYESEHNPDFNDIIKIYNQNMKSPIPSIVAIGECGLDYHLYKNEAATGKKYRQQSLFEKHLNLAIKLKLPVIMHCREAFSDFFNVIDSLSEIPKGVIHCFSSGLEDLRMCLDRNFFIGIDGNITYSKQLQMIAPQIPIERLLLETDSPYLTPIPYRGNRNEPKHLIEIAKKIAGLRSLKFSEIEVNTTQNTTNLFHLI
jgi:TatD DNase family protein